MGLFAKDFNDFKLKLNAAITAYNQINREFSVLLRMMHSQTPKHMLLQEIEIAKSNLERLKNLYAQGKPLYEGVPLAARNTDIVYVTAPASDAEKSEKKPDHSPRRQ